jgi:hypothetical protein
MIRNIAMTRITRSARRLAAIFAAMLCFLSAATGAADVLYLVDGAGGAPTTLYKMDEDTGDLITIGSTGLTNVTGIAFHPVSGVLYGVTSGDGAADASSLLSINVSTGVATVIAVHGEQIPDISFDSSGTLYAWTEKVTTDSATLDSLNTLNLATGALTRVNPRRAINSAATGLAFDSFDELYVKSRDILYGMDAATGETTGVVQVLDPQPAGGRYTNALAFDSSDVLYTLWGTGGNSILVAVNPANGETTELGLIDLPRMSAIAFQATSAPVDDNQLKDVVARLYIPVQGISVDEASFTTPPASDTVANGQRVLEWQYDTMTADQVEDLSFDVLLTDPVPGESRTVAYRLELDYIDVNDNPVHTEIGEQQVAVLSSLFSLNVATDRNAYSAGQVVDIATQVSSLSQFDTDTNVDISIREAGGQFVATVASFPGLALAAGESLNLDSLQFPVGNTYVGEYEVYATLLDAAGELVNEAIASFSVVSPNVAQVAAQVSTDQASYAAYETVGVTDRIRNPAPNAQLDDVLARTTITAPGGALFWSAESSLPQIGPEGFYDLNYAVPLGQAAPGDYEVTLLVVDLDGVVKATSAVSFELESSAESGSGVTGLIIATPNPVFGWEQMALAVTVTNTGNAALESLPLTLAVVDVDSQQVIESWTQAPANLALDDQLSFSETWLAQSAAGSTYAAVLTTVLGGEERVIDTQALAVVAPLVTTLAIGDKGRVLVLLDEGKSKKSKKSQCTKSTKSSKSNKSSKSSKSDKSDKVGKSGKSEKSHKSHKSGKSRKGIGYYSMDLRFRPDEILLPQDQLLVELFDDQGALLDTESLLVGDFLATVNATAATPSDLSLVSVTADNLLIRLQPGSEQKSLGGASYGLAITHNQAGTDRRYEAAIGTLCGTLEEGQAISEVLAIEALQDVDAEDPKGPDGSPTKLTQWAFLQSLLSKAGWSFTIVDDGDVFEAELDTGGYQVVALFNEKLKLSKSVQKQLEDAVAGGIGLVYAGYNDKRNKYLEPALGVRASRKLPGVTGIELMASALQTEPQSIEFGFDVKPLSADLEGAESIAVYQGGIEPAITTYQFGSGRSIFMGFDLLLEAAAGEPDGPYAQLIDAALTYVQQDALTPQVDAIVPVTLSIENLARLVSGEARFALPAGTQLVDVGRGRLEDGNALRWPFSIAENETQDWTFWLRLPSIAGPVQLDGNITIIIGSGQVIDFENLQLIIDVIE